MSDKIRILLIDDELEIGEVLQECLSPLFDEVLFFNDPQQAKAALLNGDYSLVISDVSMPVLQGPELMRLVRSSGNLCPVMFLTGYASKETVLSALRLGASDVIEKPFDPDQLISSINRVLESEKRKIQLIADMNNPNVSKANIEKQKKMLGLLYVTNERKKAS